MFQIVTILRFQFGFPIFKKYKSRVKSLKSILCLELVKMVKLVTNLKRKVAIMGLLKSKAPQGQTHEF